MSGSLSKDRATTCQWSRSPRIFHLYSSHPFHKPIDREPTTIRPVRPLSTEIATRRPTVEMLPVHPFPSFSILVRLQSLVLGDPRVRRPASLWSDIPGPPEDLLGPFVLGYEEQESRVPEDDLLTMNRSTQSGAFVRALRKGFGLLKGKDRVERRPEDVDLSRRSTVRPGVHRQYRICHPSERTM